MSCARVCCRRDGRHHYRAIEVASEASLRTTEEFIGGSTTAKCACCAAEFDVFGAAKRGNRVLTNDEIHQIIKEQRA